MYHTKAMHILGMARSNLDMKGAKGPKLELDFLKIAFTLQCFNARNELGKGYLLVTTAQVRKRVQGWIEKYQTGGSIEVILTELTDDERRALKEEKRKNREGMIEGSQGRYVGGRSNANLSPEICGRKLKEEIQMRHPAVSKVVNRDEYPLAIEWDFYGRT